jgi:para-aminobenzoate synthetase component 2
VQYLGQLGAECIVKRNDEVSVEEAGEYDGVLISPGPGTPEDAGISISMIKYCAEKNIPLFGVCLGHQAIGVAFGATVSRAPELLHGKTSEVLHQGKGILTNLPSPFTATRYHSLAVERETVSNELEITGATESGVVMSMRHKTLPIEGVQFHPELTTQMLSGWLNNGGRDLVIKDGQDPDVLLAHTAAEQADAQERTNQLVDAFLRDVAKLI